MSEFNEPPRVPEALLTPTFYNVARSAGIVAIQHNLEIITELGEFLRQETGKGLPAPVEQLDFPYYWNVGGLNPKKWDKHFDDASPDFEYYSSELLKPGSDYLENLRTKADIERRGTTIVEIQAENLDEPLSGALARAIIHPGWKDEKFTAGAKGWGWTIKRAVTTGEGLRDALPGFKNAGHPRLEAEARKRFAGAIVLRTRRFPEGSS